MTVATGLRFCAGLKVPGLYVVCAVFVNVVVYDDDYGDKQMTNVV
jgi:hypothetical protein